MVGVPDLRPRQGGGNHGGDYRPVRPTSGLTGGDAALGCAGSSGVRGARGNDRCAGRGRRGVGSCRDGFRRGGNRTICPSETRGGRSGTCDGRERGVNVRGGRAREACRRRGGGSAWTVERVHASGRAPARGSVRASAQLHGHGHPHGSTRDDRGSLRVRSGDGDPSPRRERPPVRRTRPPRPRRRSPPGMRRCASWCLRGEILVRAPPAAAPSVRTPGPIGLFHRFPGLPLLARGRRV